MRFYEFKTIQPTKPLTPPQAQINALKQQKERATTALKKLVNLKYLLSRDSPLQVVSEDFVCLLYGCPI